jgi:uncharacterized membrane protein HdeD (DUF308 family)
MLQIVIGSLSITLSVVVLSLLVIVPGATVLGLILFLSIVFLILGIERLAIGISSASLRKTHVINIVLGLVIVGLSIFLLQFPILTSASLVILAAVALLISGVARIIHGISREIPKSYKAATIGVGALSIVISLAIIANPIKLGLVLLVIILTITLLIAGIEMIYLGARGIRKE